VCGGAGKCVAPQYFAQQVYKREYVADCPTGKQVVWRFFDWQATVPTGTSIGLGVQTKAEAGDTYAPSSPIAMDAITATSPTGTWVHGSQTVGQVLATNATTIRSLKYLLVTMTFKPDASASLSPTLSNWRQNYDCLDGE
jgi:hypothetical protein